MAVGSANGVELLHEEIQRVATLETELSELVDRQRCHEEVRRHAPAVDWLRRLGPRVRAHGVSLRETLTRLADGSHRAHGSGDVAPGPALLTRALRDAYALLSATVASYAVVAIIADMLGEKQAAALAEAHSDDANAFLEELAGLILRLTPEAVLESVGE